MAFSCLRGEDLESVERWLSVEEVAQHLKVSKESIYRWIERGKIPAHKVGRLWRFSQKEVDASVRRGDLAEDNEVNFSSGPKP